MDDFKLKIILSILAGVIFSFVFIFLTFILPTKSNEVTYKKKSMNKFESISNTMKNN